MQVFGRTLSRALDTVLENNSPTTPYNLPQPNPNQAANTTTYAGPAPASTPNPGANTTTYAGQPNDHMGSLGQWQELAQQRQQWKSEKLNGLTVDQKIEMALKQSEDAQKISYQTSGQLSRLDGKIDRAFQQLTTMIQRMSSGQPAQEPHEPGTSIWDDTEDDPESILSS